MIVLVLLVMVVAVFVFGLLHKHVSYLTLEQVIPAAEVISKEEGIVEYKGVQYILGTSDLKMKKHLLEKLNLSNIEDTLVVDLSYRGQIILRAKQAHDALRRK
jgi:hypothetical protein